MGRGSYIAGVWSLEYACVSGRISVTSISLSSNSGFNFLHSRGGGKIGGVTNMRSTFEDLQESAHYSVIAALQSLCSSLRQHITCFTDKNPSFLIKSTCTSTS
jgi:hypothetical protein